MVTFQGERDGDLKSLGYSVNSGRVARVDAASFAPSSATMATRPIHNELVRTTNRGDGPQPSRRFGQETSAGSSTRVGSKERRLSTSDAHELALKMNE